MDAGLASIIGAVVGAGVATVPQVLQLRHARREIASGRTYESRRDALTALLNEFETIISLHIALTPEGFFPSDARVSDSWATWVSLRPLNTQVDIFGASETVSLAAAATRSLAAIPDARESDEAIQAAMAAVAAYRDAVRVELGLAPLAAGARMPK
jgi:hypothetical protein